jgi:1-acyl-sn-glycerol-3-phosphate acyltransferase
VAISAIFVRDVKQIWIIPLAFITAFVGLLLLSWLIIGLFSLTVDMRKTYVTPSKFYFDFLNFGYSYILAIVRARIFATGLDKIPHDQKFLLVSNHRSNFDNMVQSYFLKDCYVSYISKSANFKIPIGRRFIKRCLYLSIDRESPLKALQTINNATKLVESDSVSIGVFPEGHRSKSKEMGQFKTGYLRVAINSGCPIVVTTVVGTEKIHKRFPFGTTKVYFDVLGVLTKEDYEELKPVEISAKIKEMMEENLVKRGEIQR